MLHKFKKSVILSLFLVLNVSAFAGEKKEMTITGNNLKSQAGVEAGIPLQLSLKRCIEIALANNHRRKVSSLAVQIARIQHKQALSSYWPRMLLNSSYSRMDQDLNFIFPEDSSNYTITGMTMPQMTLDFGMGPITIPGAQLPPQNPTVTIPEKNITIMAKDLGITFLDLTFPLYTGGKRSAIIKQANAGISAAWQAAKRTDLMVIYDVQQMYYGTVLAERIHQIGKQTLAQLNATLELTEHLYKKGSGSVSKSDFLKNKIIVESARSTVAVLSGNKEISKAALLNTLGLTWQTPIELLESEIPFKPYEEDLTKLVSSSYKFNPDWQQLLAGLEAAKAKIKEEKSERLPKLALVGNLFRLDNSIDVGIMSPENKNGWKIGVGMQLPLFTGFLTSNKIKEARARFDKMKEEQILLKEGIALQIKHIFLLMASYQNQEEAAGNAAQSASENRELIVRAYNSELAEAGDVIQAQLMEAFTKIVHDKALYNHALAGFRLDFLVGRKINKLFQIDQ